MSLKTSNKAAKAPKLKTITVHAILTTNEFQRAKCCADDLFKAHPSVFNKPAINGMFEFQWSIFLNRKKQELKGDVWSFNDVVLVFVDSELIGGLAELLDWASRLYDYEDFRSEQLYDTLRKRHFVDYVAQTGDDFVFLDFSQEDKEVGRLVIQLFRSLAPKTSENFRALCTGEKGRSETTSLNLHYKNTVIHRVVPNGWIQGGDILSGKGNTSESIYGVCFEDETFAILHDSRGMVGMSNNGRHTNGSQFYITLGPAAWMDKKYVAFGRVIEGSETLKRLESVKTLNERPTAALKICDSGLFTYDY